MDQPVKATILSQYAIAHNHKRLGKNEIHFHDEFEIFIVINGADYCLIDDEVIKIEPYDIILFYSNQIHKIVENDPERYERYILTVKPEFLYANQADNEITNAFYTIKLLNKNVIKPTPEQRDHLLQLISAYMDTLSSTCYGKATLLKLKFMEIMVYLSRLINASTSTAATSAEDEKINRILSYINEHFTEFDCNLETISRGCNLCKNYLCAIFKKYTALTVGRYLISKRIVYAKKLLLEGYNVTESAEKAGFIDYSNFIRVFKQHVGTTPKQYQRANIPCQNKKPSVFE